MSSLSVDPPALIVSIKREASSWPLVKRYGFFGVNILTSDQIDIADRFTGKGGLKGADRFGGAKNSPIMLDDNGGQLGKLSTDLYYKLAAAREPYSVRRPPPAAGRDPCRCEGTPSWRCSPRSSRAPRPAK